MSYPLPEGEEPLHPGGIHKLSIPKAFNWLNWPSRRVQCLWSAGIYHSKACIMVIFSGVGCCSGDAVQLGRILEELGKIPVFAILAKLYTTLLVMNFTFP